MKNRKKAFQAFHWAMALVGFLLLAPSFLSAQVTSVIQGYISDPSGAAIPEASVAATNQLTGVGRSAMSAQDGYFRIPDLLQGIYEVKVEHSGFKTAVQSSIEVTAEAVIGLNFTLQVGAVTEQIEVTGEAPQVETEVARISDVLKGKDIESLPIQGRGIMTISMLTPGIQGKAESMIGGGLCCDVFSNFAAAVISSGGNEQKAQFLLDGMTLRYSEGSFWGAFFSPNPDAVAEVRVSTHPYSAEQGRMSGPQVQITTRGGTNSWHGTGHYTTQERALNARPWPLLDEDVPRSYTRYFGGTGGGPILKNRLFVFGAYEGLREQIATSSLQVSETQEFRDFVVNTRPNSIAATLLQQYGPFRYPTLDLVDLGSPLPGVFLWDETPDGIPDLGLVPLTDPIRRRGTQVNGRVDYHFPNGNDRVFASYWYSRPDWQNPALRKAFQGNVYNSTQSYSVAHTRSFSPQTFNEVRVGIHDILYENVHSGAYHVPGVETDDGFSMGNFGWSKEYFGVKGLEIADVFSLNRGRHAVKMGVNYRRSAIDFASLLPNDSPAYRFASILDFADDEPYQEQRAVEVGTGNAALRPLYMISKDLSLFFQNTWQVRPNFTVNYGLRWETFFNDRLGRNRNNWQPVISSDQVTSSSAIADVSNVKVDRFYDTDWNNFGPRIGFAWDPGKQGKLSIRGGLGILYDEINTLPMYAVSGNPPAVADVVAGEELFGIPIVYGLAPEGTRDFPPNSNLPVPGLNEAGGIEGITVGLGAYGADLKNPMVWDMFGGVQYQLRKDLMVEFNYRYRRNTNDVYDIDLNRFAGDLVDGSFDRLNPFFNNITVTTNRGRRTYHGLVTSVSKRFSQGFSIDASYTYVVARNNYFGGATDPFNPNLDWARDDIPHVFTLHSVWELPILRGRGGWLAGAIGGWQVNTIWNLQSGGVFTPTSYSPFGAGGDFNADGIWSDRPNAPTVSLPTSYSKQEWLQGAIDASVFPLPDPSSPQVGTLPRDAFRFPGYARIDLALVKDIPIVPERARLQVRVEAFNLLNRLNINSISNAIDGIDFAVAGGAYPMRRVQLAAKFIF